MVVGLPAWFLRKYVEILTNSFLAIKEVFSKFSEIRNKTLFDKITLDKIMLKSFNYKCHLAANFKVVNQKLSVICLNFIINYFIKESHYCLLFFLLIVFILLVFNNNKNKFVEWN